MQDSITLHRFLNKKKDNRKKKKERPAECRHPCVGLRSERGKKELTPLPSGISGEGKHTQREREKRAVLSFRVKYKKILLLSVQHVERKRCKEKGEKRGKRRLLLSLQSSWRKRATVRVPGDHFHLHNATKGKKNIRKKGGRTRFQYHLGRSGHRGTLVPTLNQPSTKRGKKTTVGKRKERYAELLLPRRRVIEKRGAN